MIRNNKDNQPGSKGNTYRTKQEKHDALDWLTFFLVLLTFIAVAKYTYVSNEQLIVSRDTEQRQLRAYVAVDLPEHELSPPIYQPTVHLSIRNTGMTPAFQVEYTRTMTPLSFPLTQNNNLSTEPISPSPKPITVFPGNLANLGIVAQLKNPLTPDILAKIQDGNTTRLYVWGTVRYTDTFKAASFTYHAEACEKHNDAN